MMPNIQDVSKRKMQRHLLHKYRPSIDATNDEIALEAGASLESVRRTINGVQAHPGVLQVLRKLFLEVPEWNGILPRDLYSFLTDPR